MPPCQQGAHHLRNNCIDTQFTRPDTQKQAREATTCLRRSRYVSESLGSRCKLGLVRVAKARSRCCAAGATAVAAAQPRIFRRVPARRARRFAPPDSEVRLGWGRRRALTGLDWGSGRPGVTRMPLGLSGPVLLHVGPGRSVMAHRGIINSSRVQTGLRGSVSTALFKFQARRLFL